MSVDKWKKEEKRKKWRKDKRVEIGVKKKKKKKERKKEEGDGCWEEQVLSKKKTVVEQWSSGALFHFYKLAIFIMFDICNESLLPALHCKLSAKIVGV